MGLAAGCRVGAWRTSKRFREGGGARLAPAAALRSAIAAGPTGRRPLLPSSSSGLVQVLRHSFEAFFDLGQAGGVGEAHVAVGAVGAEVEAGRHRYAGVVQQPLGEGAGVVVEGTDVGVDVER